MGVSENLQSTVKFLFAMGNRNEIAPGRPSPFRLLLWFPILFLAHPGMPAFSADCPWAIAGIGVTSSDPALSAVPQSPKDDTAKSPPNLTTSEDWNRRLRELLDSRTPAPVASLSDYHIGPEDVLEINVFEAQELNRQVRVSAGGEISVPLLGGVRAAGLTPRELEITLQELLRRTYMKDPHVSVFVREMQSHPISVMGAVKRPGVFQVRGPKSLLEVLSLAEGLSDDAGEDVIIMRGGGVSNNSISLADDFPAAAESAHPLPNIRQASPSAPSSTKRDSSSENVIDANVKDLLDSADPHYNPLVYPGDIVKVTRAGIVYVVGDVRKPGGFALKSSKKLSVVQAIALSEGVLPTAAKSSARIFRTDPQSGERKETRLDLGKIMSGRSPDPVLESNDILFVPNSVAKATFSRGMEAAAQTAVGLAIFHW